LALDEHAAHDVPLHDRIAGIRRQQQLDAGLLHHLQRDMRGQVRLLRVTVRRPHAQRLYALHEFLRDTGQAARQRDLRLTLQPAPRDHAGAHVPAGASEAVNEDRLRPTTPRRDRRERPAESGTGDDHIHVM